MRKWVNLGVLACGSVDSAEARKSVLSIDVHGARTANALSARTTESKGGVNLVLDLD